MKVKNDTKLSRVEDKIEHDVRKYLDKMGCNKKTTVEFSDRVDKNSAQTYLDTGLIVFNKDYVELNERNPVVLKNLVIHEDVHLAIDSPKHDAQFLAMYQKYGTGIKDDPLYVGDEIMTTPNYGYVCPKCGWIWFSEGKLRTEKECKSCGVRLKMHNILSNPYFEKMWRIFHKRGNYVKPNEYQQIVKSQR